MDIDEYMLAAMREVDAMLPDTPPIAPRRLAEYDRSYYEGMMNAAERYHGQLNQTTDVFTDGTPREVFELKRGL